MIYQARINKRLSNVRVYTIKQKLGSKESFLTKLFLKVINRNKEARDGPAAPGGF